MPNWFTTPLVPQGPVQRLQDQIDSPSLERSPLEAQVRGFGAGALEGLRNLSSPANLAGIASLMIPGGEGAAPLMRTMGAAEDAPAAIQGLAKAMPAGARTAEELGLGTRGYAVPRTPSTFDPAAELQAARDFVASQPGGASAPFWQKMGGQAGRVDPEAAIIGGLGAGAAAYGLPKAKQMWQDAKGLVSGVTDPFMQIKNTLDAASAKGFKR